MAATYAPTRIGHSREALEKFVEAAADARGAIKRLGDLALDDLDRQVFETIADLVTHQASAIWDKHPDAGQFIQDWLDAGCEEGQR